MKVLAHDRNYFITVQITQTVLVSSKKTRHPAESKKQQIHRGESGLQSSSFDLMSLDESQWTTEAGKKEGQGQ